MSSPTLPLSLVHEYAETQLAQRLSTVPGVAQVQIYGSQKYAVRVQANPDQLAARGIGIDELQQAIAQGNVNQPVGQLDGSRQTFALKDNGQLSNAAAYRPLIVTWRNGAPVRLEDVATPIDSVENIRIASWNVDKRAIVLAVQRQPGANTIETVDAIKRILPSFQAKLPAAVNMNILFDRSNSIRHAIDDVQFTWCCRRCWSSWSSCFSCATCRPPSSPAWRCPSRWSAPSPPCRCSATAWTTCRCSP
jgi:HAE1 family hydrophobic/amphiphilic exporter-1